jgi:hypothetical protein
MEVRHFQGEQYLLRNRPKCQRNIQNAWKEIEINDNKEIEEITRENRKII